MSCQELVELVTEYLEDALPPDERARFEAHLDECAGCRAHLAQMETTVRLVGATGGLGGRPEVAALMAAFSDWKHAR